jgi:hypothetical protein
MRLNTEVVEECFIKLMPPLERRRDSFVFLKIDLSTHEQQEISKVLIQLGIDMWIGSGHLDK